MGVARGSIEELIARAAAQLPEPVARYVAAGSGAGVTVAEATAAWEQVRFVPRVLRAVTSVDTHAIDLPGTGTTPVSGIAIAPTTLQRAVHPDGEVATAQGAADAGALVVVSSNTGTPFDAIGATGATWWLQVYLPPDRVSVEPLLARAVAAGASAIVLTADTPFVAAKPDAGAAAVWDLVGPESVGAELRRLGPLAPHDAPSTAGTDRWFPKATDLGPHDIGWLGEATGLPVVVKGVLHPDDARRCREAGAAGVWVSNHGGRQFDGAIATADALPAVRAAAEGRVYVDGGLRSARHLCAAWAGGADLAFLGRPVLAALALGGRTGVRDLLQGLEAECADQMRLLGATTLRGLRDVRAPIGSVK